MKAYQLLAKLRLLTLQRQLNGWLVWSGTSEAIENLKYEEENILREYELKYGRIN